MMTKSACPTCNSTQYIPVAVNDMTSLEETQNGAKGLKLILRTESKDDLAKFNKIFPTNLPFTLKCERRGDVVTLTPVFTAGNEPKSMNAKPAPKIPQTLDELREVAIMSGIMDAEKMSKEEIDVAIAERNKRIGKGARGRAQLAGLEPVGTTPKE